MFKAEEKGQGCLLVGSFAEFAAGVPPSRRNEGRLDSELAEYQQGGGEVVRRYLGEANVEALAGRMRDGWPEGLARLTDLEQRIAQHAVPALHVTHRRRRLERGPQGNEYDLHAGLQGRHDRAWWRARMRVSQARRVDVVVRLGAFHSQNAEDLLMAPVCALVATRLLIEHGYQVRVLGVAECQRALLSRPKTSARFVVLACDYGRVIDSHVLTMLAHPGFYRWYVGIRGALASRYQVVTNFGYPFPPPEEDIKSWLVEAGLERGDRMIFSPMPGRHEGMTAASAARAVVSMLEGLA